ncbi:MAG: NFACT RNA binding domain-containing protein, partial [Ignavibacteria bacterium]
LNKVILAPASYKIFNQADSKIFTTYSEALNEYLITKFKLEKLLSIKNTISRYTEPQITKITGKLNEIKAKLNAPSREDTFREYGNLLLGNIQLIRKGQTEIILEDFYDGKPVKIKLNETLEPQKNIDRYFEKARNEKQNRIFLKELSQTLSTKYEFLQKKQTEYKSATKLEEYIKIMDNLNIKQNQSQGARNEKEYNFKHYIIDDKYHVYAGKDSQNNDTLTVKFAKQNDFWFHARGVSGSHVVLRVENSKEVIPKPVIKKAASIAAFHSKARTSKMAPVSCTLKKYVTKKKGMEPGKVSLLREDVLLVPPEIPRGCEYQSAE